MVEIHTIFLPLNALQWILFPNSGVTSEISASLAHG